MIYSILNTLNLSKKFPYFIFTPLPYAIGTAGDQLIPVIKKAQFLKKSNYNRTNYFSKIVKI